MMMMLTRAMISKLAVITAICMLTAAWLSAMLSAQARPSLTITGDFLPYQSFKDDVEVINGADTTLMDDPQLQLRKFRATLTYPLVFAEGRTVLINEFSYQLIDFEFRRLEPKPKMERAHAASYTLMSQRKFSQKWSIWALATPSMATDLKAKVSEDDFNFQAAVIGIRHFSERFSLGFGAA